MYLLENFDDLICAHINIRESIISRVGYNVISVWGGVIV